MTDGFEHFAESRVPIPAPADDPELSLEIFCRHFKPSGASRPLLLVHGHPQTHVIWHRVAPLLVQSGGWEIVVVDTRGMGRSSVPPPLESAAPGTRYSKRALAQDLIHVMESFGHDRGARITHRMALDHPSAVLSCILLDIAPTLDMYEKSESTFAQLYWHWYFLIQPAPFPERMITANPAEYLAKMTSRFPNANASVHDEAAYKEYLGNCERYETVAAMCEDYRASAPDGVDLILDRSDREKGNKIKCPVRVIWGKRGVIELLYNGSLQLWQNCCEQRVEGRGINVGHYLPEERPEIIVEEVQAFFH